MRDLVCDKCALLYEDVITRRDEVVTCDECGDDLRRLITPAAMIGPTERHPEVYRGAGLAFTSNAAIRKYFKANPDAEPVSKSDGHYQAMYTRVRDANEQTSRALGYRDWDHRTRATPAEKAERAASYKRPAAE